METKSPIMQKCLDQISEAAKTDWSIVLQGKTGTGKTMLAKEIHKLSSRADKPFVSLDMSVIPETLIESELFGYERGAFTGAEKRKIGYFERANGGTLFLDEIENMSPDVQSKLLNAIEEGQIYPVGSTKAIDIDIRIISATNTDIIQSMKQKKFRADLYYRLAVIVVEIPALKDRVEDLPYLANKFLKSACEEIKRDIKSIPEDVMDYLSGYSFPGNVRELINIMRRAALHSGYNLEISIESIDSLMDTESTIDSEFELNLPIMPLRDAVSIVEKFVIKKTLNFTNDNKSKTAKILMVSESTLFNKLSLYGIKIARYAILFILIMIFTIDCSDNFRRTSGSRTRNRTTSQRIKNKELS